MKKCSKCKRQFFDTSSFCDKDNSILVPDVAEANIYPILIIQEISGERKVFFLSTASTVIGRSKAAQLVIEDPQVSKYHIRIEWLDELFVVKSLHSTNGSLLNGFEIKSSHPLVSGDFIQIGQTIIQFQLLETGLDNLEFESFPNILHTNQQDNEILKTFEANRDLLGYLDEANITIEYKKISRSPESYKTILDQKPTIDPNKTVLIDQNVVPANIQPSNYNETEEKNLNLQQEDNNYDKFGFQHTQLEFIKEQPASSTLGFSKGFNLISVIAEGGMGRVLLVQETLSRRYVALKVVLDKALDKVSYVQQFIREAIITARLQHPNVIPVYELGFLAKEQLYYTMRYVEGSSFSEYLKNNNLEENLRILRDASLAVHYAHTKGLWHRDLKPDNILVGKDGDVYITDWGLVSVQPGHNYEFNIPNIVVERLTYTIPDTLLHDTSQALTTQQGVIVGTPQYMSPEQFIGDPKHMGAVSDIWAFGIMLFQIITGRHPIDKAVAYGANRLAVLVVSRPLPKPSDINKNVSPYLENLCLRMLDKDPGKRMQSLKDLSSNLTTYLKSNEISSQKTHSQHYVDSITIEPKMAELKNENALLRAELERTKQKNELLTELSLLGTFSQRRKKEIWAKLATL